MATVAKDIAMVRSGSKVLGTGGFDVRSLVDLERAVDRCVRELGGIDFLILVERKRFESLQYYANGAAGNFLVPECEQIQDGTRDPCSRFLQCHEG